MEPCIFPCGMSRSGTTLLATIFDAHPAISMGYELLPADLMAPRDFITLLDQLIAEGTDAERCGRRIRDMGHTNMGKFVARCHRCLVPPEELRQILQGFAKLDEREINSFDARCRLANTVARRKMEKEGTQYWGFKVNFASFEAFRKLTGPGRFVYILRDPRDVVASHFKHNFGRTLEAIIKAWNTYIDTFEAFQKKHPSETAIVRYEDLVEQPESELVRVTQHVGIPMRDEMLRFHESSKATVHQSAHPNSENLKRGFFTSSVNRWRGDLSADQIESIDRHCARAMQRHGYVRAAAAA